MRKDIMAAKCYKISNNIRKMFVKYLKISKMSKISKISKMFCSCCVADRITNHNAFYRHRFPQSLCFWNYFISICHDFFN